METVNLILIGAVVIVGVMLLVAKVRKEYYKREKARLEKELADKDNKKK
ncbi:hypothetical protein [Niallia circulans]|nr:hypothetical protein [Niallia circulans]MED3839277.1 hypothetical protein [Niallia circulans]MED4242378.1 hypothetical protein [Niallia circulans]MED4250480.1 hypothetical protein [Niallia circulans]QKH59829.1 hypothetical protein FOC77_03720 [Niallia circulans]